MTQVYRKATNTGLPLHFKSHTDKRYKVGLLKTMLHRACALSSETVAFSAECDKLRSIFSHLNYVDVVVFYAYKFWQRGKARTVNFPLPCPHPLSDVSFTCVDSDKNASSGFVSSELVKYMILLYKLEYFIGISTTKKNPINYDNFLGVFEIVNQLLARHSLYLAP